jgi:hypothetical protein
MFSRLPAFLRPVMLTAACAAVIAAAGCSSGSSSGGTAGSSPGGTTAGNGQHATEMSASKALSLAASQSKKTTSFSATMDISSGGSISAHMTGTLQEQTKPALLAHQRFRISGGGTALPGTMETLLTGDAVYLKIPSLARALGKPWVKVSFSSLKSSAGVSLAPLIRQLQGSNPLAAAQMFPAASNVRRAGTQVINGVQTTEYTGILHVNAAMARIAPGLRKLVAPAMAATGATTARFQVWVDGQHQIRKLVENETGRHYHASTTMVITSINQPLHIQLPAASQVAAAPGM